ncbi:MAG: hypothetical protein N2167_08330 [Flavobacteriales bacterium]|nr:hypothetical protein [Flavobacteriales bacterium]
MNTPEILEKIELHVLRTQHLLQQMQTHTLNVADIEKMHNELRQAYELSVILKYARSVNPSIVLTPPAAVMDTIPESVVKTAPQPIVEPPVQPKTEPSIQPSVAEVPPTKIQPTAGAPPTAPSTEPLKETKIPAMTVAEAKVTFNDQKSDAVKEALADKLALSKIADLTKAIALHEKFLFINELFQGDNVPYNEFINKVNQLQTLDEALVTINDYAGKYHWDFESKTFQKMLIYIQRRHA